MNAKNGSGAEDLKKQVTDSIEGRRNEIIELALRIHQNPELGFEEYQASRWLTEVLQEAGYEVELGVAGMPTAFVAEKAGQGPGPTIALMCEYDALPGLGHGCAHNLIGAAAVGAAVALAEVLDKLPGRIRVLGCPAEEIVGSGGKVPLVDQGYFNGCDVAMMTHGNTATMRDWGRGSLAAQGFRFKFEGYAAHAAAAAEKGINALDAVIQTFNAINALRQQTPEDSRIHGIISNGGEVPNIIPAFAQADFFVRADTTEKLQDLVKRVKACAEGAALATGTELSIEESYRYDERKINQRLADAFEDNLRALGIEPEPMPDIRGGSTDAGNVSQIVPLIHHYVKIAEPGTAPHTTAFAEAAASELGQKAAVIMALGLATTSVDVMTRADLLTEIKAEFDQT